MKLRLQLIADEPPPPRPKTRGDCLPGGMNEMRPCPFVSCRYHLAYEIGKDTGSIRPTFPKREVSDMPEGESCALDVADRGGETLEEVGRMTHLTRERVRQIEARALTVIREECEEAGLDEDDFELTPEVSEPAGAEDGAMGAYADPTKDEPNARLRLMIHKVVNGRLRERAIAEGKNPAPSESDDGDDAADLASARALRGKVGALEPWTFHDEVYVTLQNSKHAPWMFDERLLERARAIWEGLARGESSVPEASGDRVRDTELAALIADQALDAAGE
jgi:hypothetical protein